MARITPFVRGVWPVLPVAVMRNWQRAQRDGASADAWQQWTVVVPAVLTVLTCMLLGTVGWYFLGAAIAYNCGMSGIGCSTTAKLWLAADGIGVWILAVTAAIVPFVSRSRPGLRRPAAISCWVLLAAAVSWFLLAGRLI